MLATDIALALPKDQVSRLIEGFRKGAFYVHKLNIILPLLQRQMVNAVSTNTALKGYRVTLTKTGEAVAKTILGLS